MLVIWNKCHKNILPWVLGFQNCMCFLWSPFNNDKVTSLKIALPALPGGKQNLPWECNWVNSLAFLITLKMCLVLENELRVNFYVQTQEWKNWTPQFCSFLCMSFTKWRLELSHLGGLKWVEQGCCLGLKPQSQLYFLNFSVTLRWSKKVKLILVLYRRKKKPSLT